MRFIRNITLKQFCLDVIVENIEKYIYSCKIPQTHINFLHCVYSEEIFKRVRRKKPVSEDCMLWFLNPHSKKICLRKVTEKVTKQLKIIGPTITSLDLRESDAAESVINSIVSCIPNVTHLDLSNTKCSDNTLLCIKRMCPVLTSLELFECEDITDYGMEAFCAGNRVLKRLNLTGSLDMEEETLMIILNSMPQLVSLKYTCLIEFLYNIMRDSLLTHTHYNLTELNFEDETFEYDPTNIIHAWTVLCPNVKKVLLNFAVSVETLQMCAKFQNLEDLEICAKKDEYDSDDDKWYLPACARSVYVERPFKFAINILAPLVPISSKLIVLKLSDVEIDMKILIEKFHNLKTLGLRRVTFTDLAQDDIELKENNLETLVIEDVVLNDSSCKAMQNLLSVSKKVTKLHLNCRDLPQAILDIVLNCMKDLSFLDVSSTPITLFSISRFAKIPSLTAMYCDGCSNIYSSVDYKLSYFEDFTFIKVKRMFTRNTLSWTCYSYDDEDEDEEYDEVEDEEYEDEDEEYEDEDEDMESFFAVDY